MKMPRLSIVPNQDHSEMPYNTDDLRIRGIKELTPPAHLMREFPCTEAASATVYRAREEIHRIMHRGDSRLLVIVGPCSIHDYDQAMDYAKRLQALRLTIEQDLTMGRDWRENDGEPVAPAARIRSLLPSGVQERNRRQYQDRGRCHQGGLSATSLFIGDQRRAFGHRIDGGQRRLPRHPAWWKGTQL